MVNKKKVSVNFVYQTFYQILLIATPLITTPYIARVLGSNNNGIYTYSYSVVMYFVIFAYLGIDAYGNRIIAQAKAKSQDVLDKAFTSLFLMHLIVGSIATVCYYIYVFIWAGEYQIIALIQSIWVIAAVFDINWLFFGLEEFKLTVIRNCIVKLATVASIFIFVKSNSDLWVYTVIMGLGTLISNVILWGFIRQYTSFTTVSWSEVFAHLKPLCTLFLAVIATSIYRMIDKVMLGWYSDMPSLASYEYADKMIKLVITLITALGTVMLPRMTTLYAEGKDDQATKYMKSTSQFMFVMAFALAFGLAGVADEFMPTLLGDGYEGVVLLTKVLCISLPIMGWNNLIRTQVLMPKEKDKIYTVAVWAGAIVNIILNYILIRLYGTVGAAVATVIAYFIVSIFQTIPIWNDFSIGAHLKYITIPLISGIIMYFSVRAISKVLEPSIAGIVIETIVGAVIYLIINIVYLMRSKNEVFDEYAIKIKSKLHLK